MPNVNSIRALLVGCGSIGKRHARVLRELGVRTMWAYDPRPESAQQLIAEVPGVLAVGSLEEGLGLRPDAVWILSPPRFHVAQAIAALDAGAHVFCEKPLTDQVAEVDELLAGLARTGRQCMVGHCFRFHEGLCQARAMLQNGSIGRLVSVRALMGEPIIDIRPDYRDFVSTAGNGWGAFDLIHDIDLAIWFANQRVTAAHATFGALSDIELGAPDTVELVMRFEDRCMASVHLDFFQQPRRRQIDLLGTRGTIIVEFASWDQCTISTWQRDVGDWKRQTLTTQRDDMFRAENTAFFRTILQGEPLQCGVSEAMEAVRVVNAVMQADRDSANRPGVG